MINKQINFNIDIVFSTLLDIYIMGIINFKRKLSDKDTRREIFAYIDGMLEYATSIRNIDPNEYWFIYNKLIDFLNYKG